MSTPLHFARLEQPSQALRTECGVLREPANWTTVRTLVTCPRCRELLQLPRLERAPLGARDDETGTVAR